MSEENHGKHLAERLFARFSKEHLAEAVTTVHDVARPPEDGYQEEMVEQYGRVRRFLPRLLSKIEFSAAPAGTMTLAALNYLAKLGMSHKQLLEAPPLDIVTTPWKRFVFDQEKRTTKQGYTLCVLD